MKNTFQSSFQSYMQNLIMEKRRAGFSYRLQEQLLLRFDRFCLEHYPQATKLSRKVVMHWAEQTDTESKNSRNNRVQIVRQLAKHMQSLGIEAYFAPKLSKDPPPMPHIFTSEELKTFFEVTDRMPYQACSHLRHLVVPTMFRLIYACGLRLSEACYLKREEFCFQRGEIRILHSKGYRDRLVYPAEDVLHLCLCLDAYLDRLLPQRKWFFVSRQDRPYEKTSICRIFNELWNQTNYSHTSPIKPSTHSFRHSFAVHRLNQWMTEGTCTEQQLKYLSLFMGHTCLSHTQYYVHLVETLFPVFKAMVKNFDRLLPEALYDKN
jgi:integrase/recombinase XerD